MVLRPRKAILATAFALLPSLALATPASAIPNAPTPGQQAPAPGSQPTSPPAPSKVLDPDASLPKDWRSSDDRAVTLSGDSSGLHVLAADSGQAYQWRTVATLSEPGFSTDLWIGNSCVTGSGQRAVVVYAPRQFVNKPELMQRGGFAAVVDLKSGAVNKFSETVSLAYFDPGCGTDETAVLTQNGDTDLGETRLLTVDAAAGKVVRTVKVDGQVTSAVPTRDGLVGALAAKLSRIDDAGRASELATTSGAASAVHPDADGGIAFVDHEGESAAVKRLADGHVATLAEGKSGEVGLQSGTAGKLFVTGRPEKVAALPNTVQALSVPVAAEVSTKGAIAVDEAVSGAVRGLAANPLQAAPQDGDADGKARVQVQAEVPATGKKLTFSVAPDKNNAAPGAPVSPALGAAPATPTGAQPRALAQPRANAENGNDTVDQDRTCSVPRNDPTQQAYQPTPNQVEWAVDMAVRGQLTAKWVRQGGWRAQDGLGTVDPQAMFPLPTLTGAPSAHIPPQVLLGILAQESNLWQAEGGALPGQTGNPLTGGFYGHPTKIDPNRPQDVWQINWDKVDCGYGIGQQTDGMHGPTGLRTGDVVWPYDKQKAVALDYTSNIAAAAKTLTEKWNELHDPGLPNPMKINDDDPSAIENWFTAAWAYNSGLNKYNPAAPLTQWGLGYLNNPVNPIYQPDRLPFLDHNHYADAAHPQYWPYQEKVLGWAAWPIDTGRSYDANGNLDKGNTAGYSQAWWTQETDRTAIKPGFETFCNILNNCDVKNPPRCEIDHLGPSCDPPYWFHSSATWKTCKGDCGHEYMTYKTLRMELGNGNTGAPDCAAPPAGALVVDSVSGQAPPMRDGCSRTWNNAGTLSFRFDADQANHYEAKADLHQVGGGYGAHFWYAHTRSAANSVTSVSNELMVPPDAHGTMAITGTWKLNQRSNGWTRVFVHLPDTGSETQQAIYTVHIGNGQTQNRILNVVSNSNHWVSLGVFEFTDGNDFQGVELSNYTPDGDAVEDVAWDAAAFQPLAAKPKDFVVQMGDSYSSGEGAQPYIYGTDMGPYADQQKQTSPGRSWNACRRSQNSWIRQTAIPSRPATIGSMADTFDTSLDYHSTACSGAVTSQMDTTGSTDKDGNPVWGMIGQHHEVPQLSSGFLDTNTTLVTLTAGGNDSGFADTVQGCVMLSCPSDASVKGQIDKTMGWLKGLLQHIHDKAPNAKIVLLGYPELFEVGDMTVGCSVMLGDSAIKVNGWADYMRDDQKKLAAELQSADNPVPVTFYSPMTEFYHHGVCSKTGAAINDFVAAPSTKPGGDFSCPASPNPMNWVCASMESYHPNNTGTKLYASALASALISTRY